MAEAAETVKNPDPAKAKAAKGAPGDNKKAETPAAAEGGKAAKAKKPAKRRRGGVLGLVILFLLIIMSGVFLYFSLIYDWGGVRTSMLTVVNKLDPSFHTVQAAKLEQYNADKAALESDRAALDAEKRDFESYKTQQTAELEKKRDELDSLTAFVQPIYRQGLSEEKVAEIQRASDAYAKMDPQTAASILSRLNDDTHVAIILYYMDPTVSAEILSNMSADLAARVTTILLKD